MLWRSLRLTRAGSCSDFIPIHSASGRSTRWAWQALARALNQTYGHWQEYTRRASRTVRSFSWYWKAARCCVGYPAHSEAIRALMRRALRQAPTP